MTTSLLKRLMSYLAVSAAFCSPQFANGQSATTFTARLNYGYGDPNIYTENGILYLHGTGEDDNTNSLSFLSATSLATLGTANNFVNQQSDLISPQHIGRHLVYKFGDRYYTYYHYDYGGSNNYVEVASSTTIDGVYDENHRDDSFGPDTRQILIPPGSAAYDSAVLTYTDGAMYLMYVVNANILIQRMADPITLVGDPVVISSPNPSNWEGNLNEAPFPVLHNGILTVLFAGGTANTYATYAVGELDYDTNCDTGGVMDPQCWAKPKNYPIFIGNNTDCIGAAPATTFEWYGQTYFTYQCSTDNPNLTTMV